MRIAAIIILLLSLGHAAIARAQAPATATAADTSSAAAYDWPGFLGPKRNGKSDERGLPITWPAGGPTIVWQAATGTGYAAPAIAGSRLYHFGRFENSARLTCLDAQTGAEQWTCEYPTTFEDMFGYNNGPRATPVVDGPHVYTYGAEGVLQCVRVDDGQVVWRIDTIKDFGVVKNFFGVGSTPLVYGDVLIVCVGGSPPDGPTDVLAANGRVEPNGSAVVAFDKATGKLRWKTGDDLASYSSPVLAKFNDRDVVYMFARGGLLAIDPTKGEVLAKFPWRSRKLESVNASTPVVVDDEIFISETYEIGSALVRFTGGAFEEIWTDRDRRRNQAMALHWNTPIEHDGYLYGSSGYHASDAEFRCVEWKTGRVMWSEPGMGRSSLLLVDGMLVSLSEDGTLRLLKPNPLKYEEIAKWEMTTADGSPLLPYPAWAAPALSRGLLYVEGANRLVCLKFFDEK